METAFQANSFQFDAFQVISEQITFICDMNAEMLLDDLVGVMLLDNLNAEMTCQ